MAAETRMLTALAIKAAKPGKIFSMAAAWRWPKRGWMHARKTGHPRRTPSPASKAHQYVLGIVAYVIRKQLREEGKLLSLRGVVSTRSRGHIPAVTDPKEVGARLSKRTASTRSLANSVGSRNPLYGNSPT